MAAAVRFPARQGQGGWSWRQIRLEVEYCGKRAEKMEAGTWGQENVEGGAVGTWLGVGNPALPLLLSGQAGIIPRGSESQPPQKLIVGKDTQ